MNSHASGTAKRTLIVLLAAFVLPVALAYLFLTQGWYQGGTTNRGQLLDGLSYQTLSVANPAERQWQIITLLPDQCRAACQDRLAAVRQAHIALGREQDRVVPLVYLTEHSDPTLQAQLTEHQLAAAPASPALQAALAGHALVVVDPLGQWVMAYPAVADQPAQIQQGRDLLADLRKLLKLSRIG
ncbi:hypothetical protein [Ferrimonas balearica]|uniref:hypothetical protein n=1 Tax=Ferrimonas balearica TaxID=44012 RepID=UPI001C9A0873|nr:hypothetical protein [Ferrimonas balearica]MBY5994036.1 hypothetical protein [Ferrimonas balearica]